MDEIQSGLGRSLRDTEKQRGTGLERAENKRTEAEFSSIQVWNPERQQLRFECALALSMK